MKKNKAPRSLPYFVLGDLDGFFGLSMDNIMQLILIGVLCREACGFPMSFVTGRILPGAGISILVGNLFYAWQARQLAKQTGRKNVTALPFGINTVSLLAFIFLVMAPVYYETDSTDLAWKAGLAACFVSGLIETLGAFFASWIKKNTPRAALLSGLGGVALSFMVLGFSFQIFSSPSIAIVPLFLILILYGGQLQLPLRIPEGLFAILIGVALAWGLKTFGLVHFVVSNEPLSFGFHLPYPAVSELFSILFHPAGWKYLSVVLPMGFFNVISSIQNLESAEAAGDHFKAKPSLLVNGFTSILAALLGSPFPTTIYIGHPGWKAMGARSGYSALNGIVIALLCFFGGITALLRIIPIEVALGILVWIGLVIVGQSFTESDRRHSIAVVLGFIPPLAAWALHLIESTLRVAGTSLYDGINQFGGELYIHGIISLYQGFLLISILFSAIVAYAIDREFLKAAMWSFWAAFFSAIGLIHAYELTPSGIHNHFGWLTAPWFTFSYATIGIFFLLLRFTATQQKPE